MAVTFTPYGKFLLDLVKQAHPIDFDVDTIRITLHTASYTPDRDAHEFCSDLTNELAASGGYTTGGKTLTGVAVGYDGAGHFAYVDADDPVWTSATFTARYAVVAKWTGSAATSPLIAFVDFGAAQSPAGIDFGLVFAAAASGGMVKIG